MVGVFNTNPSATFVAVVSKFPISRPYPSSERNKFPNISAFSAFSTSGVRYGRDSSKGTSVPMKRLTWQVRMFVRAGSMANTGSCWNAQKRFEQLTISCALKSDYR